LADNLEKILCVSVQSCFWKDFLPLSLWREQRSRFFLRAFFAGDCAGFNRAVRRKISYEEACIHDDAADDSGQAEAHDTPVVAWGAAAARFPAVHPFAAAREFPFDENWLRLFEEIFLRRKELIVCGDDTAAEALGCEVGKCAKILHA
jgi:hypothetical protein